MTMPVNTSSMSQHNNKEVQASWTSTSNIITTL